MPELRFLIIGLGSIGERHLHNLRSIAPRSTIAVLRQSIRINSETAAPDGANYLFSSKEEALDFNPVAAIIASPAPFHVSIAITLAERGIHLLIEKPLSDNLSNVERLIEICKFKKLKLLTAYNFRFSESAQRIKQTLESGDIGTVVSVNVDVGQYLPDWRQDKDYRQTVSAQKHLGGGVLLELSHEFDYLRWFIGEVDSVFAYTKNTGELEVDVEDCADLLLKFTSGAVATVHLDFLQRTPYRTSKYIGDKGILTWNAISGEICVQAKGSSRSTVLNSPSNNRNDMYVHELKHFIDCIVNDSTPVVTGYDGLKALEIVAAAKESSVADRAIKLRHFK